jgi:hypothetical protein
VAVPLQLQNALFLLGKWDLPCAKAGIWASTELRREAMGRAAKGYADFDTGAAVKFTRLYEYNASHCSQGAD